MSVDRSSGLLTVRTNSRLPASVTVLAVNGVSTTARFWTNLHPGRFDVDLGASVGAQFPTVAVNDKFNTSATFNTGGRGINEVRFTLEYDSRRLLLINMHVTGAVQLNVLSHNARLGTLQVNVACSALSVNCIFGSTSHLVDFEFRAVAVGISQFSGSTLEIREAGGSNLISTPQAFVAGHGELNITASRRRGRRSVSSSAVLTACTPAGQSMICSCYDNHVDCSNRQLRSVPSGIPSETLRLDLGSNLLTKVAPDGFANVTSLRWLGLRGNQLSAFDGRVLDRLERLSHLDLSMNQLASLGPEIAPTRVAVLNTSYNRIKEVQLDNFTQLRTLDMRGNPSQCELVDDVISCRCTAGHRRISPTQCQSLCTTDQFMPADVVSPCQNCTTACREGTFRVLNCSRHQNTICQPCSPLCSECTSQSECGACVDGALKYGSSCFQSCPPNTFREGALCRDCDDDCLTCSGPGSANCSSCRRPAVLDLSTRNCVAECPDGMYPLEGACFGCTSAACTTCTAAAPDTCTLCTSGFFLHDDRCVQQCPHGHRAINSTSCAQCDAGCASCSTSECTSCMPPLLLHNGSCVQSCPNETFVSFDPVSEVYSCGACSSGCASGSYFSSPCTSMRDRQCTSCSICDGGSFKSGGCANDSDTECSSWSACEENQWMSVTPSAFADVACSNCSSCGSGEFLVEPCTGTRDAVCRSCSLCRDGEHVVKSCEADDDTACGACPTEPDSVLPTGCTAINTTCASSRPRGDIDQNCVLNDDDVHLLQRVLTRQDWSRGVDLDFNFDGVEDAEDAFFLAGVVDGELAVLENISIAPVGTNGACNFSLVVLADGGTNVSALSVFAVFTHESHNFTFDPAVRGKANAINLTDAGNLSYTTSVAVPFALSDAGLSIFQMSRFRSYLHVDRSASEPQVHPE